MARNVELVYIATDFRVHATRACLNLRPVMDVDPLTLGQPVLARYFGVISGLNLANNVAPSMGDSGVEIIKEMVLVAQLS